SLLHLGGQGGGSNGNHEQGGGGGGASDLAPGGDGGRWMGRTYTGAQDGGLCAGGGGGTTRTHPGGKGGAGYAKVTIINLKEAASCGMAAVAEQLQPYVADAVRKALA